MMYFEMAYFLMYYIFKWRIFWLRIFTFERKKPFEKKCLLLELIWRPTISYSKELSFKLQGQHIFHRDVKVLFNVQTFCVPDPFFILWGSAVALPTQPRSGWLFVILWWKIAWKLSCKKHYLLIPKWHEIHFVILR